ncbi:hypothetical protein ACH4FA_03800 [Streptomyces sp. NPDC017966]|uniref:hypothetical protein n=1 Tax=Streptomyces sp. NPDC017966 TaxID=3365023 RepID=UPI0037AD0638
MMIGMQPEVLSGLIGFGGAVVGAGAAIVGTAIQQKHAKKMAQAEREANRQEAAFETALQAVFAAQDLFRRRWGGRPAEEGWEQKVNTEADRLRLAMITIAQPELQQRLKETAEMLRYWKHVVPFGAHDPDRYRAIHQVIDHMLEVFGAYRSSGAVPPPSKEYAEAKGNLDTWIEEMEDQELREREGQR